MFAVASQHISCAVCYTAERSFAEMSAYIDDTFADLPTKTISSCRARASGVRVGDG